MRKTLRTTIAAGAATAMMATGTNAIAAEVTYGDWASDNSRWCYVTLTADEATNLARIQKQAAQNFLSAFDAERGKFSEAERALIEHQRVDPDKEFTDEEIAARDARLAELREAVRAELDEANGPKNEQEYAYEYFASQLVTMDSLADVSINELAASPEFKSAQGVKASAINPDYSAEDELKLTAAALKDPVVPTHWGVPALQAAANEYLAAHHARLIVQSRACAAAFDLTTSNHPLRNDIDDEDFGLNMVGMEELIASGTIPDNPSQAYFYAQPLEGQHTVAEGVTIPDGPTSEPTNPWTDGSLLGTILGALGAIMAVVGLAANFLPLPEWLNNLSSR